MSAAEIQKAFCAGCTVQPAVTPFSEKSKAAGKKGTADWDFSEQQLFMIDIDNEDTDAPQESPERAIEFLAGHRIPVVIAYRTFSSSAKKLKFRIGIVCDEVITDRRERDRIQQALIKAFPQADTSCQNADRMFFGTNRDFYWQLIKLDETSKKSDLLTFTNMVLGDGIGSEAMQPLAGPADKKEPAKPDKIKGVITQGNRNTTLSLYAGRILKQYGDVPETQTKFNKKAAKCVPPLDDAELDTIYQSAQKFLHKVVEQQAGYVSPDKFNADLPPFVYLGGDNKLHISAPGLAALFAKEHPYKIVTGTGDPKIYLYENGAYSRAIEIVIEKILADYITDYNPQMLQSSKVAEAYKILYLTGEQRSIEEFNADEKLVCLQNCVYDFINRKRYPHSPDRLFTVQLNAELPAGPVATPVIDAYMADLMIGNPQGEQLIYEVAGVAFSNVKGFRFKKALFLIGRGNSGKTQIKQLAERIVGQDNFNNTDLTTLETNRFAASGFQNKRLCGSNDMSFMRAPEINQFKMLTGGDHIDAERKFETSYSFRFDGVLWFVGNQMPLFGGDKGDHVYDRILPLQCNNTIPAERQIKDICDRMFTERGGFVLRALEAARAAVLNNYTYTIPNDSEPALEKYKTDNSELRQFIDEWTLPHDGEYPKNQTAACVFRGYKRWCEIANAKVRLSKGLFRRELYQALGMPADSPTEHRSTGDFFPVMLTDDAVKESLNAFL